MTHLESQIGNHFLSGHSVTHHSRINSTYLSFKTDLQVGPLTFPWPTIREYQSAKQRTCGRTKEERFCRRVFDQQQLEYAHNTCRSMDMGCILTTSRLIRTGQIFQQISKTSVSERTIFALDDDSVPFQSRNVAKEFLKWEYEKARKKFKRKEKLIFMKIGLLVVTIFNVIKQFKTYKQKTILK